LKKQLDARTRELAEARGHLSEALEQQTATAEVLSVISSTPGELEPVFEAMLVNAVRICEAKFGTLYLREGDAFRAAALHNAPPAFVEFWQRGPHRPGPSTVLSRVLRTKQVVHICDITADQAYIERDPLFIAAAELGGFRTVLAVPMLKETDVLGSIYIYRQEVRPFSDKQIKLLSSFAAQAVIAIENTRLLNELRESLQQQTATADVLKVISRSTFDLRAVLDTLVESATKLCEADLGNIARPKGDGTFWQQASYGFSPALKEYMERIPIRAGRGSAIGRALLERAPIQIPDVQTDPDYQLAAPKISDYHTIIAVPLMREGTPIGVFAMARRSVRPFTDKQIELVETFADQAVIAIENARLFEAEQQRTRELSESLQQQTATADVLKVISRSTFDLQAVFEALIGSAARLCEAENAFIFRYDGDIFRMVSGHNVSPELAEFADRNPIRPGRGSVAARVGLERRTIHVADVRADPEYSYGARDVFPFRTVLGVPMLRGDELLGALILFRPVVRPFGDKQIQLVETFADQAVIAIENVRLFDEVQARTEELSESLQQQTATADVLKVISRSTFDLVTVLETLVASAARLCDADKGFIARREGTGYRLAANVGFAPEFAEYVRQVLIKPGRNTLVGRTALEGRTVHISDIRTDREYTWSEAIERSGGVRTVLGVPLLREGVPIGVFNLARLTVRPFTDKQIELVSTFADQAVIAIENVRLFDEIQDKNRQLQQASENKSQFVSSMSHELRTPLNAIIGLTEMMVTNAARFGTEKAQEPLQRVNRAGTHLLGLINQVLDLSKIEAGKLELNPQTVQLAPLIDEVIGTAKQLAQQNKNRLAVDAQDNLGALTVDPMRLRQILLNLLSNACKFTKAGEVKLSARNVSNGSNSSSSPSPTPASA
jgi:GAF domain-containing protein